MINDPKQIVTPFAFEIHRDLLGVPLATPQRRLAALLTDLLIASILTALGSVLLATSASILFFWLAVRNRGTNIWKNFVRFGAASILSLLVFLITFNVTGNEEADPSELISESTQASVITNNAGQMDWQALAEDLSNLGDNDSTNLEDKLEELALKVESQLKNTTSASNTLPDEFFEDQMILDLRALGFAISNRDTLAIDTLRESVAPVLAYAELKEKNDRISTLNSRINRLSDENEILAEEAENPSFIRGLRATARDFGLSIGWIGVYFVLCTALFQGQTVGKKLFSIRVIRLNKKPIGLLYSFERFGGYAAGLATGLVGFFQIYWDANRQAIHDKIAGTVVVDLRESRQMKFEELRKEILAEEDQNTNKTESIQGES